MAGLGGAGARPPAGLIRSPAVLGALSGLGPLGLIAGVLSGLGPLELIAGVLSSLVVLRGLGFLWGCCWGLVVFHPVRERRACCWCRIGCLGPLEEDHVL